jgi:proteic killer suppression protein
MKIRSVRHKGLKRFIEDDDAKGIRPDLLNRVRNIMAVLIVADDMEGVSGPPEWRIHQLTGNCANVWSIAASGNWRITFTIDEGEISDLDLEDYH